MDGYPLPSIPPHVLQPGVEAEHVDAGKVFQNWLTSLGDCLTRNSYDRFPELFLDDCWWRDFVSLHWDFSTKHGQHDIIQHLTAAPSRPSALEPIQLGGLKPLLVQLPDMVWIQGGFTFKTQHGRGRGLAKLLNVGGADEWKAWTVFSQLESLDFQRELEEQKSLNPAALGRRLSQTNGVHEPVAPTDDEVQVLIVGAGQAGLSLGVRLKSMGIRTLLVDRHARLGDAWRSRYRSLMMNTPTYTDHPPFMKIPENWPRWLSRDAAADFLEHYGQIMGVDVITDADVTEVNYDEKQKLYRAILKKKMDGGWSREITARQVVLATGVYSDTPVLPDLAGQDQFRGQLYHSSKHESAEEMAGVRDKRVIIVGAGSSAHDIAQDFVNAGARAVSIVQRSAIYYLSAESSEAVQLMLWNMDGLTTDEADLIGNATPLAVIRTMSIGMTRIMTERDRAMIAGLREAGMVLKTGDDDDGYGLADYQLIKGGNFYLDQGAG